MALANSSGRILLEVVALDISHVSMHCHLERVTDRQGMFVAVSVASGLVFLLM